MKKNKHLLSINTTRPQYFVNKGIVNLFYILTFLLLYACGSSSTPTPQPTAYKVTFNANKPFGIHTSITNQPREQTINNNATAIEPVPAPTLSGYNFMGWYEALPSSLQLQDNAYDFATSIIEDISLFAKWKRQQFTVTYHGNKPNGTPTDATLSNLPNPELVNYNQKIAAPNPSPMLTGYRFTWWYTEEATTNAYIFSTRITTNINLYAKWTTQQFTVTYHGNKPHNAPADATLSNLPDPVNIDYNKTTTAPTSPPMLTYYDFVGWYDVTTGNEFNFSTGITENKTIYAKWLYKPVNITFNLNYINAPVLDPIPTDMKYGVVTPPNPPAWTSTYTLGGWYTKQNPSDTDNPIDFNIPMVAPTTLYARWIRKPYKITFFHYLGSAPVISIENTNQEGKVTPPDISNVRANTYTFNGWYKSIYGGDRIDFTTEIFNEAKFLYAQWLFKPKTREELLAEINRAITPSIPSPNLNYIDTSLISDMSELFLNQGSFNGNISSWNVSLVEDMGFMFSGANVFNQNISSWNVSRVKNMSNMFRNARGFNQNISSWTVSLVEDMSYMFSGATAFNGNISSWNVSKVTNMEGMFSRASAFNQDLNNWNVSLVENMSNMFRNASRFNGNISSWNVSQVKNMSLMFFSTVFNQNISSWNVSKVTDMKWMFAGVSAFNQNLSSWNVSLVEDMSLMFGGATAFNQNISSWNVSKVTNMSYMFQNVTAFNQNISSWNVSQVENMNSMFRGASAFNQNISSWNVSLVEDMGFMFLGATAYNQNISSWNVAKVRFMYNMFDKATAFNQDISSWNVSLVENMQSMFSGATAFNQDISSWNVAKVIYMDYMFSDASTFNGNISNWNVSIVTNMESMFNGATVFNGNISNWRPTAITNMSNMFKNASGFTQNIDSWNIARSVEKTDAFLNSGLAENLPIWAR